jgi:Fe-S-cluster containining protein
MAKPTVDERAKRVYESCAALIGHALRSGWNEDSVVKVAEKIAAILDQALEGLETNGVPLDCKPKCTFCCHRMITAQPVELIRIWSVVSRWTPAEKLALGTRIKEYANANEGDRLENFRRSRVPCPFLEDDLCSIHEQRPAMCRTACSQSVQLCQTLHEDNEALRAYSPNDESHILRAALSAMFDATRPFGPPVYLQLFSAIGRLLEGPDVIGNLLNTPSILDETAQASWDIRFAPAPNRATVNAGLKGEAAKSMELRSSGNLTELLKLVPGDSTSEVLARIDCPAIYESADQIPEWRGYWEKAIEQALDHEPWNAFDAYHDLVYLKPIKAGYAPYEMRSPMEKLGKLICEKTAKRLAPELCERLPARKPGKVRLGVLGSMGARSGTAWSLGWIRNLDKTDIESYVLNVGQGDDALTYAFKDAADHYLQLRGDPLEIAKYVRGLDLDYLIYCDLGEEKGTYQWACFRLARRQAASWGCPFTSGLPTIDDYLTFDLMEAPVADQHYSENLVRLPGIGLVLTRPLPNRVDWGREQLGLPEGFLVAFPQHGIKWLPTWDELLAKIAERTGNPVLMLEGSSAYRQQVLEARMERHKVPVYWIKQQQTPVFRRLLASFDVVLDSLEWSGGLTAIETFSQRTPFVTLPGPYLRQRLGVGIARKIGADALIAKDAEDYLDLSTSKERLAEGLNRIDLEALYGDLTPLRALEKHVLDLQSQ